MTREKKIRVIYKEIANKEITFGCKIFIEGEKWVIVDEDKYWEWIATLRGDWWVTREKPECEFEVVGHPVMIGDVMYYIKERINLEKLAVDYYEEIAELSDNWKDERLSIEQQSDECVDFVYNLIKK